MKLHYSNDKVEKYFTDAILLQKKIGFNLAKALKKRKDQLESFQNIFELMGSGIDNPHLLKSDLYGCISWSISGNVRLILDLELKLNELYSPEIATRTKICIKGVVDYHGGKDEWLIY